MAGEGGTMQEERLRILEMVQEGQISTAEGQPLLVDVQDDESGERVEIYIG